MIRILITGAAGFIGASLALKILQTDHTAVIVGIDNLNDYYSVQLKKDRLQELEKYSQFTFEKGGIEDRKIISGLFKKYQFDAVINLAAQAGVRYSILNPDSYVESNIIGFYNILEACRQSRLETAENAGYRGVRHLIYASSSSVYGANRKVPYSVEDKTDSPVSLYAATKKTDELLAYAYASLYGIPCTGLRFFTVYGPMGRPDMAYFKFTEKMIKGQAVQIYNHGDMYRDFTYIDDVVNGILAAAEKIPEKDEHGVRHTLYNIGESSPEKLTNFVDILERILIKEGLVRKSAEREYLPMQAGDVYRTCADMDKMMKDFGFHPQTTLEKGLEKFVRWYKKYYEIQTSPKGEV